MLGRSRKGTSAKRCSTVRLNGRLRSGLGTALLFLFWFHFSAPHDDELLIQKPTGHGFTWLYGRLKRLKEINPGQSDVLKVDARTLVKAYTEDQDAADKKYKGKLLEVTGVVTYRHSTGINLEAGTDLKPMVMCAFGADRAKALQKIWRQVGKGAKVTVTGTCNGFSTNTGSPLVTLDNCNLIDPPLPTR